jgi:hypothetical protein
MSKTKHLHSVFLSLSTITLLLASLGRAGAFRSPAFSRPSRRLVLAATMPSPPVARREEDRVVLAGVGPPPRQSESSPNALLDPPVPVPDPYVSLILGVMKKRWKAPRTVMGVIGIDIHILCITTYVFTIMSLIQMPVSHTIVSHTITGMVAR